MLWLPWIRRIPPRWLRAVMALTVGLLAFLAIDATLEGLELAGEGSQAFGGAGARAARRARSRSCCSPASRRGCDARRRPARPAPRARRSRCSSPSGIGLHNLGEGVAIGSAYSAGALALGAFLVVGFALHNTTEGLAIVAPIAAPAPVAAGGSRCSGWSPARPAVLGAWIGAAAFNAEPRRVPVRLRRRRDRPGDRRSSRRRCATTTGRTLHPARRRPACWPGMALMFATGPARQRLSV